MDKNAYLEINASQRPALALLEAMGYTYMSPADCDKQRGSRYHVLLRDILRGQLRRLNRYAYAGTENEFSAANIERAMEDLDEPLTDGLVRTSEKIYDALLLGKSYPETVGDGKMLSFNLKYIDWDNPQNNVFHVTEEFAVDSQDRQHNARPDIVLFINGIPFAVIECKAPHIPVDEAVGQMIRNQQAAYIPQLFKFAQLVVATNKNAVKYATAGTPKKFWSVWKEQDTDWLQARLGTLVPDRMPTEQDRNIVSLFSPERVFDLIRYFILFDANVKKVCRYQQFFAVREIMKTISESDEHGNRQSGVIWHTQGSGKSLTMVMLAKYILMELRDCHPRVVIVTDRKELDAQIAATFAHTRLTPARATSGRHLVELVNSARADVITSIINKFNTVERQEVKNPSCDIFVLVDESHRSNYGLMATRMRSVFPNACYIGFTGTPLMKSEKNTMTRFGKLIHKYTIRDGVEDGAIVPLIYEGRFVEQKVDEENIDLWFKQTTRRLTEAQREDLRRKWSSIRRLTSTDARIKRISARIAEALNISGPFNIQYLAKDNYVKVIECNLRASRSFPFVSKVLKKNFIETATRIMLGEKPEVADTSTFDIDYIGVKASQFSFARLHKADPVLGVDMSSTGEVGCLGQDFDEALLNAMLSVGHHVPKKGILVSSGDVKAKVDMLEACRLLDEKGYALYATPGTAAFLSANGVKATQVCWPDEEGLSVLDVIGEHTVDLVINIPKNHTKRELTNGYHIRRHAIDHNIPLLTNARLALAYVKAFVSRPIETIGIRPWQEY